MQLIRRVFPLFKNSIKKNHHFQSFLNSSETRLQHFFAFHVCFYCLYGNNKQKNQTFNLLYIAALSRLWLHFKKSSNSDLGKVLWKVLLIHKICTSSYIFNVWYIFFSILSTYTSTTTNYVLCTWSINNTVWARYIMKCIIRSISLWTELISRQYFRIFLFNNLHSFSQDSAYLSTKYLYSKTKKSTWIWASEKYFIYKHNFYYNFYSFTRYLYGLHLLLNINIFYLKWNSVLFETWVHYYIFWGSSIILVKNLSIWIQTANPISKIQNAAGTHKFQTFIFSWFITYSTFFKSKTF